MTAPILCPGCGHDIDKHNLPDWLDSVPIRNCSGDRTCECGALPSDIARVLLAAEPIDAEEMGTPVTFDFHDGKPRGAACGLEACECPDHEWEYEHPRPAGLYVTFRLDGNPRLSFGKKWRLIETGEAVDPRSAP